MQVTITPDNFKDLDGFIQFYKESELHEGAQYQGTLEGREDGGLIFYADRRTAAIPMSGADDDFTGVFNGVFTGRAFGFKMVSEKLMVFALSVYSYKAPNKQIIINCKAMSSVIKGLSSCLDKKSNSMAVSGNIEVEQNEGYPPRLNLIVTKFSFNPKGSDETTAPATTSTSTTKKKTFGAKKATPAPATASF